MLPGGQSDKLGNRYETWWTVLQLVRLLAGKALAIQIETPGIDEAEFTLSTASGTEYHQCKRSLSEGKWSLSKLGSSKHQILQKILPILHGNSNQYHFASGCDAPEIRILVEGARLASSFASFKTDYLASTERQNTFDSLIELWSIPEEECFDILQRIYLEPSSETLIRETTENSLRALYTNADGLSAELRTLASDHVSETVSREQLVTELEGAGYRIRPVRDSESALIAVGQLADEYVASVQPHLIGGQLLSRPQIEQIREQIINSDRGQDIALLGPAGTGKSVCGLGLVESFHDEGIPVLPIRLDRRQPCTTSLELGRQMGLDECPAHTLSALRAEDAILLIDQLDAVSTISGRNAFFFDVIESLSKELKGLRIRSKLHFVVVCREFDWENDPRLKGTLPSENRAIILGGLKQTQVAKVLEDHRISSSHFNTSQWALLENPQNLSLLIEGQEGPHHPETFTSTSDLFRIYWDHKRNEAEQRSGEDLWVKTIDLMVNGMTQSQQLSVPSDSLDEVTPKYLEQLVSGGVLSRGPDLYAFNHESFFDYCFARRFAAQGDRNLLQLLDDSGQDLFCRSQVRQVLTYLRESDQYRVRYQDELGGLLSSNSVRAHIKDLALKLVATSSEILPEEQSVLQPFLDTHIDQLSESGEGSESLNAMVADHLMHSQSWFSQESHLAKVAGWLDSNSENLVNLGITQLRCHQRDSSDLVADLLSAHRNKGESWRNRFHYIFQLSRLGLSRRFFDLFLYLLRAGDLDEVRGGIAMNGTFWSLFTNLEKERPAWVAEIVSIWLERRLETVLNRSDPSAESRWQNFFGADQFGADTIQEAAKRQPQAFLEQVLPIAIRVSQEAKYEGGSPVYNHVWYNIFPGKHLRVGDGIQTGLVIAIQSLGKVSPDTLAPFISVLINEDGYFSNCLLLQALASAPENYAALSVRLLTTQQWRFEAGYYDSSYWISRSLLSAISPYLSSEDFLPLEKLVCSFSPAYETSAEGYHVGYPRIGRAAHCLLGGITEDLRSPIGRGRWLELERRFGDADYSPSSIECFSVVSPISKRATDFMSDREWLRAFKKYGIGYDRYSNGDFSKGGPDSLAFELQKQSTEQPERFEQLAQYLPDDSDPCYLAAILRGIAASDCDDSTKVGIARTALESGTFDQNGDLVSLMGAILNPLDQELSQALCDISLNDPNPNVPSNSNDQTENSEFEGRLLTQGMNSNRGKGALAIAARIRNDPNELDQFNETITELLYDPSWAVRACVGNILIEMARDDIELAIGKLEQLAEGIPELLDTHYSQILIHWGLRECFVSVRPMIEAMLQSPKDTISETGSRLASIAVLDGNDAADLVNVAINGTESQRRGVALVAASNLGSEECRSWCLLHLPSLFDDDSERVRSKAASCFRKASDCDMSEFSDLIEAFIQSPAFSEGSDSLLSTLADSRFTLPEITVAVCQRFIERFGQEARDFSSDRYMDQVTVTSLIFRIYNQHRNTVAADEALDLIDLLISTGLAEANKALGEFER